MESFLNALHDTKKTRKNGDDLGIFIYIFLWIFVSLTYSFSQDSYLYSGHLFYFSFDIVCILFIILYMINWKIVKRKKGEEIELFTFPNQYEMLISLLLVAFSYLLLKIYAIILFVGFMGLEFNANISYQAFELFRIIPAEELVFRGAFIFIFYYILSKISFHKHDSREIKERKKKSQWDRNEIIIWVGAIIITAIIFGLYHLPRYYNPETFPYVYIVSGGQIQKIHIARPILYLIGLGLFLGYCRYKFGLTSAIFLHMLNNWFSDGIIYILITIPSL